MSLNLKKSAETVLNLTKDLGVEELKARIILVLDYSGSMAGMYDNGFVQRVVERIVPIAMAFDDNGELETYLFHDNFYKVDRAATKDNIIGYVDSIIKGKSMGGTNYAPVLNAIVGSNIQYERQSYTTKVSVEKPAKSFWGKLFGATTVEEVEVPQVTMVPKTEQDRPDKTPTYVIFITDGENGDRANTIDVIKKMSHLPIFIQFIGLGPNLFSFLKQLDEMEGRFVDNANFFEMTENDLRNESDETLYRRLLNEFAGKWIFEAATKNLIQ